MKVLELTKYQGVVICGQRGSGKSAFLEFVGEQFYKVGRLVLDLFDSGDFESCFWCIPLENSYPILLVHPSYCELDLSHCNFDIKAVCDEVGLLDVCKQAIQEKRIVVFGCGLYEEEHQYKVLADWLNEFPRLNRDILQIDATMLLREASNVVFSHLKTAENQTLTRKALLRFIRIARHYRTSFVMDSQRLMDIYKAIRENLDKTIVKSIPIQSLPELLRWVVEDIDEKYQIVRPHRFPQIPYLRRNEFYCITENGYFFGTNPMPSFLHKQPHHNFLELANISIEYSEILEEATLTKREIKELDYLRRAASIISDKIYQRELILNGKPFTFREWAKETNVSVTVLTKYANQK